jgi:SM-20-related protein
LIRDWITLQEDYESHFAFYAPGTSFSKHVDRFRDNDSRTISAVIYLNEDWLAEHGGAFFIGRHGAGSIT